MLLHRHDFGFSDLLSVGVLRMPLGHGDQLALVLRHDFETIVTGDLHSAAAHFPILCLSAIWTKSNRDLSVRSWGSVGADEPG